MYMPKRMRKMKKNPFDFSDNIGKMRLSLGLIISGCVVFGNFGIDAWQRQREMQALGEEGMKRRSGKHIVIVGCGPAGGTLATSLLNRVHGSHVTILEPNRVWDLKAMYPLAVVGHRAYDHQSTVTKVMQSPTVWLAPQGARFVKASAEKIDPKRRIVTDSTGENHEYDVLVLANGAKPDLSSIKGLKEENLNKKGICTEPWYARDWLMLTHTGNVLVSRVVPKEIYRRSNDSNFLGTATNVFRYLFFFGKLGPRGCNFSALTGDKTPSDALHPDYISKMWEFYKERGMELRTDMQLTSVDPKAKIASFTHSPTGTVYTKEFNALLLDLPLKVAEPMASAFGEATHGFATVDHQTLQHKKYPEVFALGDCAALPTIKSYSAVFTQVPIVSHNVMRFLDNKPPNARYDGYTAFPLEMSKWQWMWPEMSYGGKREQLKYWDNAEYAGVRGFMNGFPIMEQLYELFFWFCSCYGEYHPQLGFSYPQFEE